MAKEPTKRHHEEKEKGVHTLSKNIHIEEMYLE